MQQARRLAVAIVGYSHTPRGGDACYTRAGMTRDLARPWRAGCRIRLGAPATRTAQEKRGQSSLFGFCAHKIVDAQASPSAEGRSGRERQRVLRTDGRTRLRIR